MVQPIQRKSGQLPCLQTTPFSGYQDGTAFSLVSDISSFRPYSTCNQPSFFGINVNFILLSNGVSKMADPALETVISAPCYVAVPVIGIPPSIHPSIHHGTLQPDLFDSFFVNHIFHIHNHFVSFLDKIRNGQSCSVVQHGTLVVGASMRLS